MMSAVYKELKVIEHPYVRSAALEVVMVITFIMTVVFLSIDDWAEAHIAALMAFAWFLVSFTINNVTRLLHGHAAWLRDQDSVREVDDAR